MYFVDLTFQTGMLQWEETRSHHLHPSLSRLFSHVVAFFCYVTWNTQVEHELKEVEKHFADLKAVLMLTITKGKWMQDVWHKTCYNDSRLP